MTTRTRLRRERHRLPGVLLLFALAFSSVVGLSAHPASDTSVVIAVRDPHTIEIAIASDASALVAKLEALSGAPMSGQIPTTREALALRLTTLTGALADHAFLSVNGVRVPTRPGAVFVDEKGLATMHLESVERPTIDIGHATLTWRTDLMFGSYPLIVRRGERHETIHWLDGAASSDPIGIARPSVSIWEGVWLGFTHIVPKGLDHILFVLGLFLLSPKLKQLVWQVSAFTLAHTVTLGLSLYGIVAAPGAVVEPLIALSVAYVGVENLFTSRLRPWRIVIVFGFGLLHGLGFAGAMSELPYSHADLIGMLVSFNAGVEAGQLSVIAAATVAMRMVVAHRQSWQRPAARLASAGVGAMGLLWAIERLAI